MTFSEEINIFLKLLLLKIKFTTCSFFLQCVIMIQLYKARWRDRREDPVTLLQKIA